MRKNFFSISIGGLRTGWCQCSIFLIVSHILILSISCFHASAFSYSNAASEKEAWFQKDFIKNSGPSVLFNSLTLNRSPTLSDQVELGPADRERIEADVSTRTIAITSGYSGSEVLVFGAIENSKQPDAVSGFYDVVVVVEGMISPLTLRKKDRHWGVWLNSYSLKFNSVPTFYALAATRPIEEFIDEYTREELGVGFNTIVLAASSPKEPLSSVELTDYKNAIIRLKQAQGLYQRDDKGVVFTGRSLFRATIHLPASVPVGQLKTRLLLFRKGMLLSTFQSQVMLEREGLERWVYAFAFERPFFYGFFTVLLALLTGLVGSVLLHRRML